MKLRPGGKTDDLSVQLLKHHASSSVQLALEIHRNAPSVAPHVHAGGERPVQSTGDNWAREATKTNQT